LSPSLHYFAARLASRLRPRRPATSAAPTPPGPNGISLVIPSRNGRELLSLQLPGIVAQLPTSAEIVVVDNGSGDGTAQWLAGEWPTVAVEVSPQPLSFARAVNRGVARARFSHVCLLNNDMLLEPGFFDALLAAFSYTPGLFCATAQIRFPAGVRREETGKAVMAASGPEDFPVRCDDPLPGEDQTWVLYGSGGCSLYDAAKLRALGGVDEAYEPAYVEDLDLGYRAWQRGWPSVYVAGAQVEHRHRATTSRYFREEELAAILEINYLKFLVRAVASRRLFRKLWDDALGRLRLIGGQAAQMALRQAAAIALSGCRSTAAEDEAQFLALTDGSVACFPGEYSGAAPATVVAAEAPAGTAPQAGCVLVVRCDRWGMPPREWIATCREVVLARNSAAWQAAVEASRRRWTVSAAHPA
jgi:GT2 family glycosyltransferase